MANIHVGDYKSIIRITIKDSVGAVVDLSAATTKDFLFKKPDGTVITRSTTFTTDGTDGVIEYALVDGDIDQDGTWSVQSHLSLAAFDGRSSIGSFTVVDNLE